MGLYESLASAFDVLFPINPLTAAFIGVAAPGNELLDVGCASGAQIIDLAAHGWTCVGLEPSVAMLSVADKRILAMGLHNRVTVQPGVMQDLARLFPLPRFNVLLCLGNTVPHLEQPMQLSHFMHASSNALKPGGRLILQLLNYRKVLRERPGSLPLIEKGGYTFSRFYQYRADGRIDFITTLEASDLHEEDSTVLYPFTVDQVKEAATDAGLRLSRLCSSWDGQEWQADSSVFAIAEFIAGS